MKQWFNLRILVNLLAMMLALIIVRYFGGTSSREVRYHQEQLK